MPEQPRRDGYVTATHCLVCATTLHGRTDQRYCGPTCRQAAYRGRTPTPTLTPTPLPTARSRREFTVYECGDCGQRLAGQQWCPDCQGPARRIGPGGSCPNCGDAVTIAELSEVPMP